MGAWIRRTYPNENGERFVVKQTKGQSEANPQTINFWHVKPGHTSLFTFVASEKYCKKTDWNEDMFRELLADLKSPKPSVAVVRVIVDGFQLFNDLRGQTLPGTPPEPKPPEKKPKKPKKPFRQIHSFEDRVAAEAEINQEPAPFILYGCHIGRDKEYAWRLTPDKPKRKGIKPGDIVLAWTSHGWVYVEVTRIEPAEGKEQPTARVKRKLYSAGDKKED